MKGFRDFLMQGNLLELAVAVIIGGVFGAVVSSFTQIIMDIIGLFGGQPNFDQVAIGPINVGVFLTSVVTFVITGAIIYFLIVKPVNDIKEHAKANPEVEDVPPTTEELLTEIRDLLARKP